MSYPIIMAYIKQGVIVMAVEFLYIYIHKSLDFTVKLDLSINNNDIESLTIEILSNKKGNTLINALFRPPNDQIEPFENFFKQHILQNKKIELIIPYY